MVQTEFVILGHWCLRSPHPMDFKKHRENASSVFWKKNKPQLIIESAKSYQRPWLMIQVKSSY
jgi:hypothetical protein